MLVSQCCGAPLDPKFPNDEICNECKEHCATWSDEEIQSKMTESREERATEENEEYHKKYADNEQGRDQFADSE